jgi:hypothetical protein
MGIVLIRTANDRTGGQPVEAQQFEPANSLLRNILHVSACFDKILQASSAIRVSQTA